MGTALEISEESLVGEHVGMLGLGRGGESGARGGAVLFLLGDLLFLGGCRGGWWSVGMR